MERMNDRNYRLEAEQKLFRFLKDNDDKRERSVNDNKEILIKEQKRKQRSAIKANQASITNSNESSSLSLETYLPTTYKVSNIILDSSFKKAGQNDNNFVLKLSDPLKNIVALRILRTEFINYTNPDKLFDNSYLYLNGYINTYLANETNTQFFGRLIAGTETYTSISSDIRNDPFIYIFRPIEHSLSRFDIKILNADGSLYNPKGDGISVVITLAVYTIPNIAN